MIERLAISAPGRAGFAEVMDPRLTYVRVDWNEDRRGRISLIQASRLQCR